MTELDKVIMWFWLILSHQVCSWDITSFTETLLGIEATTESHERGRKLSMIAIKLLSDISAPNVLV